MRRPTGRRGGSGDRAAYAAGRRHTGRRVGTGGTGDAADWLAVHADPGSRIVVGTQVFADGSPISPPASGWSTVVRAWWATERWQRGGGFHESALVMRALGAVDAVNLDGGGSTAMTVGSELVTRPSDATGGRAVGDAVVVSAG